MKKVKRYKRLVAGLLAVSLLTVPILSNIQPFSEVAEATVKDKTGLKLYWTDLTKDDGTNFGWPRKTYLTGGTGEYTGMSNMYTYCVANHTGQPGMGTEAWVSQELFLQNGKPGYQSLSANAAVKTQYPDDNVSKFVFCLAAAAAVAPGKQSLSDLKDPYSTSYKYVLAASVFLAIEGRMGPVITQMDKAHVKEKVKSAMQAEFGVNGANGLGCRMNSTVENETNAHFDEFIDDVYDAAMVMYNAINEQEGSVEANTMAYTVDPSDSSKVIVDVECLKNYSVWQNYYANIKVTSPNWILESSAYDSGTGKGKLVFKGQAGVDITQDGPTFEFNNTRGLTDLSKPVLYEFDFLNGGYQTMFCAMPASPTIRVGGPPRPSGPPPTDSEGGFTIEIHRYKHTETWQTTYNVDLIKNDSETGKPLEGSHWDILEYDTLGEWSESGTQLGDTYLDHPVEEASNIGTNYNWANDSGTQFTRWEEDEEDPCDQDNQVTGEDGYLYEANTVGHITNTKAHSDTYDYTYTKGYCTGHPKPEITPFEGEGADEKNAELEAAAEEAWQEQVDYCEKLAAEGGFFHTAEESISDAAKQELEADRDKFYKDFVSLTYDYSAKETQARLGYILHGLHTDDIPVERVVIHSSEYLSEFAGAGGGSSDGGEDDGGDDFEETDEYAEKNSAVVDTQDEEMDMESIQSKISTSRGNEDTKTDDSFKELAEEDIPLALIENHEEDVEDTTIDDKETVKDKDSSENKEKSEESKTEIGSNEAENDDSANKASPINKDTQSDTKPEKKEPTKTDTKNDDFVFEDDGTLDEGNEADEADENDDGLLDKDLLATNSNALRDEVVLEDKPAINILMFASNRKKISMYSDDGDDEEGGSGGGYARDDAEPPKTDGVTYIGAINFEPSEVEEHKQGARDIECWTFIAYDHRTEGEIHFNKRDLDLVAKESGDYSAYADANGDGDLEGAVYGLFTTRDIVHPDSNGTDENELDTGIVYKAGDLVAVTTTDRNGDASFLSFTEQPGRTYNYETGQIEKRTDIDWDGPSNLHCEQNKADNAVEDNEKFYGWDAEGSSEVTLIDSDAGDGTYYNKHSSNQGLNMGEGQDEGSTYPILNDEDNNMNYWIGRPLIVKGTKETVNYYIKELSRSEGYELSVYGKDMTITNRTAFEEGGDVTAEGNVSITPVTEKQLADEDGNVDSFNELTVSASGTKDGFDVTLKNLTQNLNNAQFYKVISNVVEKEIETKVLEKEDKPAVAPAGQAVLINGEKVEATLGQMIDLPNGTQGEVKNTVIESPEKLYVPYKYLTFKLPDAEKFNAAPGVTFKERYNSALTTIGYREPGENASWMLVPKGSNDQESLNNLTEALKDYAGFHRMKIVSDSGANFVVQYSPTYEAAECIYDLNNQLVFVRKNVTVNGNESCVYAKYNAEELEHTETGFIINNQQPSRTSFTKYEDLSSVTFTDAAEIVYWAYEDGEQMRNPDGSFMTYPVMVEKIVKSTISTIEETEEPIDVVYDAEKNSFKIHFDENGTYKIRVRYNEEMTNGNRNAAFAEKNCVVNYYIAPQLSGTYIKDVPLDYPGQETIIEDYDTIKNPIRVQERPIRQKVKIVKDIQTMPNSEEYLHDTYSEVHKENLSKNSRGSWYEKTRDWLTSLLGGEIAEQSASKIPQFRFKAYLKSNLERLYRDGEGNVVWLDHNGNPLVPEYRDTNGDGNYETFVWISGNNRMDFPEKGIVEDNQIETANVQKIYTKVEHVPGSTTTGEISNNTWAEYNDPQIGETKDVGELRGYSTSQDGENGEAVKTNASLYSYDDKNINVAKSDKINQNANTGYTRLLESTVSTIEDGAGKTRQVETYNYEKFFDAMAAANTDKWDNDMWASNKNYPGQHWFDTFEERYQMDDTDPDRTLANVDGADADGTAGGDHDTSFKPFQWIREHMFGTTQDAKDDYPATHDNDNLENRINTSDIAHWNAEASDEVRQFAIKWYLDDEVAKLVKNNGYDEDVAKAGSEAYQEEVYDQALEQALIKAYNYLKPFYDNDLDTIYAVEWDSAENGGSDGDVTTLSADILYKEAGTEGEQGQSKNGYYYGVSAYLPYGTYVAVEQQPFREDLDDFDNKHFKTDKPKEIILPAVYEEGGNVGAPEVFNAYYNYDSGNTPVDLARKYLLRFNEEWADNHTDDLRNYVIRAHNFDGDYEIYKYGLDVDKLRGSISYPKGNYSYAGYSITQDINDPWKDYYNTIVDTIHDGGNSNSHYFADDKNKGITTANGTHYADDAIEKRYHFGSISENAGTANDVIYQHGSGRDDNNPSGFYFKDNVKTMTGNQTAYEGKYASMLVPWSVVEPADSVSYDITNFTGYTDSKYRNTFYVTKLRIEKVDSETGEQILHDDAIFSIYAASRYTSRDEIEKAGAPAGTEIGDVKFYMEDTMITGSREFLMSMGAWDIEPVMRGRSVGMDELYTGIVAAGTPVCLEDEQIIMEDMLGAKTGQFKVYTTLNDVKQMIEEDPKGPEDKAYADQNTGYLITPQPLGAGVYVIAETKAPSGYAKTRPIAIEVYSDSVSYYMNGLMDSKVESTIYQGNLMDK